MTYKTTKTLFSLQTKEFDHTFANEMNALGITSNYNFCVRKS